jgi:hypothetical protein
MQWGCGGEGRGSGRCVVRLMCLIVHAQVRLRGGRSEHFKVEEPLLDETLLLLMSGEGFGKTRICDHLVSNMRVLPLDSFQHAHSAREMQQQAREQGDKGARVGSMDYLNSLGDDNLPLSAQMQGWSEPRELSHYIVYEAATATQVTRTCSHMHVRTYARADTNKCPHRV